MDTIETQDNPLDALGAREKAYNMPLSRLRVKAEHVFAQTKTFKIVSGLYRNKRKRYGVKCNITGGFMNLKNGFSVV